VTRSVLHHLLAPIVLETKTQDVTKIYLINRFGGHPVEVVGKERCSYDSSRMEPIRRMIVHFIQDVEYFRLTPELLRFRNGGFP
jgi:hypothetical protein